MINLEKLLLLKSVTFFSKMPDDVLLETVTSAVKEKAVSQGEQILRKGEINSTIYIIVSGKVRIHDDEMFITELSERDIFGELSALSGLKTVTSVSTLTDCFFLTIGSDALYELMGFDVGLSKGIIEALCHRTQLRSSQIRELLEEKKTKV